MSTMDALVIADSRGRGIKRHMERILPEKNVQVLAHSGAGFELAAIKSLHTIRINKPHAIIIMAGVCDITRRDRTTKITQLRYENVEECVQHVINAAKAAYELLEAAGQHKISIATVTGLNLTDYNNRQRKYMTDDEYDSYSNTRLEHSTQDCLNDSIIEINRQITALNKANAVPSTWTSTTVHSYYRKRHHHNYQNLADGCHPNEETKLRWAKQIAKSVHRMMRNTTRDGVKQ